MRYSISDSIACDYERDHAYPDPSQVEAEYGKATLMPASRAWLRKKAVPDAAMAGVTECASGFVRNDDFTLRFVVDPPGDADAVRSAFHLPVTHAGKLVDLLRFERDRPRSFLHYGGRVCHGAMWLGQPEPPGDGVWPNPTHVWRTPLAWLRSGRRGLVFLRNSWPTWRLDLLRSLPAVMGEDAAHTLYLHRGTWDGTDQTPPPRWGRIPASDIDGAARIIARRAIQKLEVGA